MVQLLELHQRSGGGGGRDSGSDGDGDVHGNESYF
jgi:hypothetical protein